MRERWLRRAKHYFQHSPRRPSCLAERDLGIKSIAYKAKLPPLPWAQEGSCPARNSQRNLCARAQDYRTEPGDRHYSGSVWFAPCSGKHFKRQSPDPCESQSLAATSLHVNNRRRNTLWEGQRLARASGMPGELLPRPAPAARTASSLRGDCERFPLTRLLPGNLTQ